MMLAVVLLALLGALPLVSAQAISCAVASQFPESVAAGSPLSVNVRV
jgi:hypothetical protein